MKIFTHIIVIINILKKAKFQNRYSIELSSYVIFTILMWFQSPGHANFDSKLILCISFNVWSMKISLFNLIILSFPHLPVYLLFTTYYDSLFKKKYGNIKQLILSLIFLLWFLKTKYWLNPNHLHCYTITFF